LTTWFRANNATVSSPSSITFSSAGLGTTTVHSTASTEAANLTLPTNQPAITAQPHLAFQLRAGFKVGFNSGAAPKTLAAVVATLEAARKVEEAKYIKYGKLAGTKRAVQSAVMWQTIFNPCAHQPTLPLSFHPRRTPGWLVSSSDTINQAGGRH
jgi:hypothetical protein